MIRVGGWSGDGDDDFLLVGLIVVLKIEGV